MLIRSAKDKDCNILSDLAYKSKAYWGYTEDFLKQCKDDLTVTKEYIRENPVYLMESDNNKVDFIALLLMSGN